MADPGVAVTLVGVVVALVVAPLVAGNTFGIPGRLIGVAGGGSGGSTTWGGTTSHGSG